MSEGSGSMDDVARRKVAVEDWRLAHEYDRETLYHATMAVCLSTVGDSDNARTERGQATVLRRAAQIKRDTAQKYDRPERGV